MPTFRSLGSLVRAGALILVSGSLMVTAGQSWAGAAIPIKPRSLSRPAANTNANAFMRAHTPAARLPGEATAPPMPKTTRLPASEMTRRTPQSQIRSLGWSQIPGGAQTIAASPDGSIWVVSSVPYAPLGNAIWHYAGGSWSNIPGVATRLSVGPDGTLWAINGSGGIYCFANGSWTTIAGAASDLSVAADGSLYVISSIVGNAYGNAIYHYSNGVWTQMPGAGVRIAASWDPNTYPGGIGPGGYYLINALGWIYYYSPSTGYLQLPGAAAQFAPTVSGGLFALGVPLSANGDPIYYEDVSADSWVQEPGAAVSIATNSSTVYAVGAAGGIYAAPVVSNARVGPGAPLVGPGTGPGNLWGPPAVANALNFPVQSGFDGSGYTVAIVANGAIYPSDLQAYSSYFQIPATTRSVSTELIDGASSIPNTSGGSFEATLDTETIAGLAPGANIILYVTPDLSQQSDIDAYNTILSDGKASVVSSSFSGCESSAFASGLSSIFQAGANAGVAFIAASGDQGNTCFYGYGSAGQALYTPGVGYPASDPNVIGVGGSETFPPAALTSTATWNDHYLASGAQEASGGGVSSVFALPSYQQSLAGTASQQFRDVPDLSMPAAGASLRFAGAWAGANGTSWSAPQFAAMLAEVYQYCGTAFTAPAAIPYLVDGRAASTSFIDVLTGNDQFVLASGPATPAYAAGPGYDNATGIGVPLGVPFAQALCPNGTPAFGASSKRRGMALRARAARPFLLNVTPRVAPAAALRRKPQNEPVRVQIVLVPRATVASDEQAVIRVLRSAGFSIVKTFRNHLVVDAVAPTANVERLFKTQIDTVSQGRFGKAYLPVTLITVPASLAPYLGGISVDNVVNMRTPSVERRSLPSARSHGGIGVDNVVNMRTPQR